MSKSLGNVVDPFAVIEEYGVDTFRYYMLRHVPSYDDGDFNWQHLSEVYKTELANELGNLVQRSIAMTIRYLDGKLSDVPPPEHDTSAYNEAIAACKFDRALDAVWDQIRGLNQYIDEEKPWEVAKNDDRDHLQEILAYLISSIDEIADLLTPFLPDSAQKIKQALANKTIVPVEGTLFPRRDK